MVINGTVTNGGGMLEAAGGVVELANTTVNGGMLRVTDDANSLIRFSGDVALHGVTWEDPGAGEFQVYRTTARIMGDGVPAGQRLVVTADMNSWCCCGSSCGLGKLVIQSGMFTNAGIIEVQNRGEGAYNRGQLYLEGDVLLAGQGEVWLRRSGSYDTNFPLRGSSNAVCGWGRVNACMEWATLTYRL